MAGKLHPDSEFVVKEEIVLVFILTGLSILIFIYGILDLTVITGLKDNASAFTFLAAIVPAIYFFRKGFRNPVSLRINRKGIYEGNRLITGWESLVKATITQKTEGKWKSVQDNFQLVIDFYVGGGVKPFRHVIPLTNTQNKSEEEVMAAIRYFVGLHAATTSQAAR